MAPHDHPVFTQVYKWLARAEDAGAIGKARTEVSRALHGRLLVVGLGPAEDLHHLPETVTEVVGIEPSASMRKAAAAAVDAAPMPVEVIDAMGEQLPLPDNSVDSALFAYVLCSVEDPELVIAEALRVLRPGGTIAVLEHVKAREGTWMRRAQRLASPVWPHLAGGCRCDQDTRAVFEAAGLDLSGLSSPDLTPVPPVAPSLVGTIQV
ncbi:MAG: class I SAM-dependent methyltransferase [Actinobacteria bacterium]|mgnify:CR=1 FL=1|nr:class I SAM-dependent methyltransferase [Actinomycetota bacterium]MCB8998001.1 class I SAM-dependent methyltransferase [Actinomycetota bacterium]HRY09412.1 class I SAM-dependent methyltransferase [Candidatus Nanopelagicales bacterium]